MSYFRASVGLLLIWLFFPLSDVLADGFRNPFHDAAAIGQGNAFRAQADSPSAVYYNPAGLPQLSGLQHAAGVQLVSVKTRVQSANGQTVHNDIGGVVGFPPPGQFFLTGHLRDLEIRALQNVSLGLGMLNLYGFANEYPDDGPFAGILTRGQLPLIAIKPTIGIQLTPWLSIGGGADIFTFASFLGEGHNEQQSVALGNIPGTTAGDRLELNGKGTTTGMNLALLLTAIRNDAEQPLLNLGFVWRSQAVLPLKGKLLANGRTVANASTSLRFPESYEWAVAVWPIRHQHHQLKFEVDLTWVRWSSIRNFDVSLSNGVILANPQDWNDALTFAVGTEYRLLNPASHPAWTYALRLGYNHSQTPIPDKNFNPAFPDSDVHGITAGFGFTCAGNGKFLWLVQCGDTGTGELWRKTIGIDFVYMGLLWEDRTVTGSPLPGVNGKYHTRTHSGGVTIRVRF